MLTSQGMEMIKREYEIAERKLIMETIRQDLEEAVWTSIIDPPPETPTKRKRKPPRWLRMRKMKPSK